MKQKLKELIQRAKSKKLKVTPPPGDTIPPTDPRTPPETPQPPQPPPTDRTC